MLSYPTGETHGVNIGYVTMFIIGVGPYRASPINCSWQNVFQFALEQTGILLLVTVRKKCMRGSIPLKQFSIEADQQWNMSQLSSELPLKCPFWKHKRHSLSKYKIPICILRLFNSFKCLLKVVNFKWHDVIWGDIINIRRFNTIVSSLKTFRLLTI